MFLPIFTNKILFFILIIFFGTFIAVGIADSENGTDDEFWKPNYKNADEFDENNKYKNNKIYYATDATCGVRDENGNFKQPNMEYKYGDGDGIGCLQNFHKRFGPVCGDPAYPRIKYCSMVHFFDNNEKAELKEDEKDMLLALIDGCAVCNRQNFSIGTAENLHLELAMKWTLPKGSYFTGCDQKTLEAGQIGDIKFRVANNKRMVPKFEDFAENGARSTFVLPGIFYQRHCKGMFSSDDLLASFKNIKLSVKHNCDGSDQSFDIDLPELITKDHQSNMAEMRGLLLDLDKGKALLYNFYGEGEPRHYIDALKWGNWDEFSRVEKALLYTFYGEGEPRHYIDALKWGNWDEFSRVESPKVEATKIDE